ncbi:MAG: glycoside hydrolase family 97 N-terminal domain-containing protein, partial [Massilibacteroides sp.]|nr:glycoside hydrolase family 97 N-terminal domain-containing protein [Massilibacteroides sp.]
MKNFSITKLLISIAFLGCVTCGIHAMETYQVSSPSGKVKLEINQAENGLFYYSFMGGNKTLLQQSRLGYQLTNGEDLPGKSWFVSSLSRRTHSDVWHPVWGKRRAVSDCYNELTLQVATNAKQAIDEMQLEFRVYNEGVAFRYVVPQRQKGRCKVSGELTNYVFTGDYTAWFYNGEYANIGPEKLSESAGTRSPVMTVKADATHYMAIHEADLRHGMPLSLSSTKGSTSFEVEKHPAELYGGFNSAWRILFYGDTPGVMVDSHLVELLNLDPSSDYDFSWVKPGIALWDWRINGAKVGDFTYTMSYPSWIRMVNFASEQGFNYLVLDANWYGPEFEKNSDPTVGDKANDVRKLIVYAKAKGVGIWLYLNDVGGRQYPLAQTLQQYAQWGVAGVKYGFM